jgi:hypothetical protein
MQFISNVNPTIGVVLEQCYKSSGMFEQNRILVGDKLFAVIRSSGEVTISNTKVGGPCWDTFKRCIKDLQSGAFNTPHSVDTIFASPSTRSTIHSWMEYLQSL